MAIRSKIGCRVLVTGGAGFIGSHLSEELLTRGYRVTVLDDLSTGSAANLRFLRRAGKRFRFIRGSILNEPLMRRLVREHEIVFHLAAAVGVKLILDHPIQSILTNVSGTEILLRLADRYQRKILIASSSEVYGKSGSRPLKESDDRVLGPTTVHRWSYSDAKAMDEFLALAYVSERGLKTVLMRFFNVVGPRQVGNYGMVIPRFIRRALDGRALLVYGNGSQRRSFTDVADAVRAAADLAVCKKAEGMVVNIGSTEVISVRKLAEKIIRQTRSRSRIRCVPYREIYGDNFEDVRYRAPDLSRLRRLIGYKPHFSLSDTIDRAIRHFKAAEKK